MDRRLVEAYELGQRRPVDPEQPVNLNGTMGVWRTAAWERDPRAYRCGVCHSVVPWSKWTADQQRAWEWDGSTPNCCDQCSPAPANASRDRCHEAGDDAPSHQAGAGFVYEGE